MILLGHEDVWHGFIDIVFSSHTGQLECIATAAAQTSTDAVSPQPSTDALELHTPKKIPRTEDNHHGIFSILFKIQQITVYPVFFAVI